MTIGNTIKKLREENNLTQEYMADRLGIQQSTYSKIERDEIDVSISKIQKIAHVFNVSLSKIFNSDSNFNVSNNTFENSQLSYNTTNQYLIDKKIESLYEDKIRLLEDKIKNLEINSFKDK